MSYTFHQPTSPIVFESPPLAPDDTIYTGSDEEESVEEQEAQRRRIHLQAQHYLQGGQLFILSAQLLGPFDGGWVNPWAGKRKRKGQEHGLEVENGRMQKGGDTADKSITMLETAKPSRTWLRTDNAYRSEILETRFNSPTLSPAMKSPEGTLSTMTTLDRSAEVLQECLKVIPPSTNPPAFEFPPLIRKDGDGGLECEKAVARAKAQEETFRGPSFKPAVDIRKLKSTSGNLAPRNHEESPAKRLQEFNSKRREIKQANYPSERDDESKRGSALLPARFNKTRFVEVGRLLEAIPSQNPPRKRRRLEEDNVLKNADGGAPVLNRPLEVNNENEEIISTQGMIDAASPFNVSDHRKISPIPPTKSKPSLFSNMGSSGMSASGSLQDGQPRPQLLPRGLGERGFDLNGAITETLQFVRASQIENEMKKDTTNP